jgi:arabinofuranosyltransferase
MTYLKRHPDLVASLALIAAVVLYALRFVNFDIPPFEDAAMLMRYAEHLAQGHGIVWNIGDPPVDGATDFLFMVISAGLIKAGLPVGRAVRVLGFAAHLATVLLVYWANRKLWHAGFSVAIFSALYAAVGTGLAYVAAFFGTPVFALFAALTWTLGLLLIDREDPPLRLALLFALSGLLTGLLRPEGVILAGFMLVAIVVMKGWRASRQIIAVFVSVFLILGGAYFFWRWDYFGFPLPNPFYKKSGGFSQLGSLQGSWMNVLRLCAPFVAAYLTGLLSSRTTRRAIAFLVPVAAFASVFVLISDEMNYGARFQYALVPIVLLSWVPLARPLAPAWGRSIEQREKRAWTAAALAVAGLLVLYSAIQNCFLTSAQQSCAAAYEADGRYEMGKILSDYQGKGYVLATSEAGLLPFYSKWTAIDAWGLNDPWIAHHGEVTDEYLERYKPQLIVFHAYFSPLVPAKLTEKNLSQDWYRMTVTLMQYAESHGYVLAAAFGDSPYEAHYYYVRPDFADSVRLVKQISSVKNYYWPVTGKKSINYAQFPEP